MYAKLKMKLKVNDVEKLEEGFRIYSEKLVKKKVGPQKYEMKPDFFSLKSEVDLSRHIGKTITVILNEPFSPSDSSNVYFRILDLDKEVA